MKKLSFLILGMFLLVSLVASASAADVDVAYLVLNPFEIQPEITTALSQLGVSYEIVCYNFAAPCTQNLQTYNLSKAKVMVIDDGYFPNYASLNVNNKSAILLNGYHMQHWGWVKNSISSTTTSLIKLNNTYSFSQYFPVNFSVYTTSSSDIYYLDSSWRYQGMELIGMNQIDNQDAIIALARAGTTLTKSGYPDTKINANTFFMGTPEATYWTTNTKNLFKNMTSWLLSQSSYTLELKQGTNFISIPIKLNTNSKSAIFGSYPEITSVKRYFNGNLEETSTIYNSRGYVVTASAPVNITLSGELPSQNNITLDQGMNLIGVNSFSNIALTSLNSNIKEVARRNQNNTYSLATRYAGGWYNPNSIALEPGKAYWFKTSSQIQWGGTA